MYNDKLKKARTALISGGVKPKVVRRTILELRDHYNDLRHQYLQQGLSEQASAVEADRQMGEPDIIVREVLRRPELKSLISTYPKSAFLGAPVLCYLLVIIAWLALMFLTVFLAEAWSPQLMAYPTSIWLVALMQSLEFFMNFGLPVFLACLFVLLAQDRDIPRWMIPGCILIVALLGSLFSVHIGFPQSPDESGVIGISLNIFGYLPGPGIFLFSEFWSALLKIFIPAFTGAVFWLYLRSRVKDVLI